MRPPLRDAAEHWGHREQIEVTASAAFRALGEALESTSVPSSLAQLAYEAADDELRHADQCRALVERFANDPIEPVARRAPPPRWPGHGARATLYAAVAMGCVTETLSVALLVQIREQAIDPLVAETAHAILRDEVRHSRLGWACLAHFGRQQDVSWLATYVPAMWASAAREEIDDHRANPALLGYGVVRREDVDRICATTFAEVIVPGLRLHGVDVTER